MSYMEQDGGPDGIHDDYMLNGNESHEQLLESEGYDWEVAPNLDRFFTSVYRYWEEKGFWVITISQTLNLLALSFTVFMSGVLLLCIDYRGIQNECLKKDTCDIWEVMVKKHPLAEGLTVWNCLSLVYLAICSLYCLLILGNLVMESRSLNEIRHFYNQRLGISERRIKTITWPEVLQRLVQIQETTRLCASRDLDELDIVQRILRRENYLIGMLNAGVLALNAPVPGFQNRLLLTKTLEWNLYWCVLDDMFDDQFRIKPSFLRNVEALQRKFRVMGAVNLVMSPFLLAFLLMYFFMKKAEQLYHHPSSLGARYWSPLARWRLREFNEVPHFINHRLNASNAAAEKYILQFPMPAVSHIARFVAFVAGSFAALLLLLTLVDGRLLERDLLGQHIVWWLALLGIVLTAARAFIVETTAVFNPEAAMSEVVTHTHFLPRYWRNRAHTEEVQQAFQAMFPLKAALFFEELASIVLTPVMLWSSLHERAGAILAFVEQNTVNIDGVGDVCSLAVFDLRRYGNARYGSAFNAPKGQRSHQGKVEKSFVSFAAAYPSWQPGPEGQTVLSNIEQASPVGSWVAAASVLEQRRLPHTGASGVFVPGVGPPEDWPAEDRVAASQVQLQSYYVSQQAGTGGADFWAPAQHAVPQTMASSAASELRQRPGGAGTALHDIRAAASTKATGRSSPLDAPGVVTERSAELLPMYKYGSM